MKKRIEQSEDDLRPEYDFSKLQIVARGPGRKRAGEIQVTLAPDVAEKFPDSDAVNAALRSLINRPSRSRV
jgi:hypothetical protein